MTAVNAQERNIWLNQFITDLRVKDLILNIEIYDKEIKKSAS